jgi:ADP-ribosylglycohydrolase
MNNDDGAAMRMAPVGVVYAGAPERAAEMAGIEAGISHDASGVWAGQGVAAAVAVAMVDGTTSEISEAMLRFVPADSWLGRTCARARALCEQATAIEDVWDALHTDFYTPEHSAVEEAIPQIYAIFRLTDGDFRKGMFWAANFGRDADTIAAVIGALSGARQGVAVIPPAWIEKVRKPSGTCLRFAADEDVIEMGDALAELAIKIGDE